MEKERINMIENNPVVLATSDKNGDPHTSVAAFVKIKEDKIVITCNYMKKTIENLGENSKIMLVVWDKNWKGYQISGVAEYFQEGKWYEFVKSINENKEEHCKGAIVIKVNGVKEIG